MTTEKTLQQLSIDHLNDDMQWNEAQGCAIKVCDEMLNEGIISLSEGAKNVREFWIKVKEELEHEE